MIFKKYDSTELEKCGQGFVKALLGAVKELDAHAYSAANTTDPSKLWTEYVLDWFAATVAKGHVVDARRRLPELGGWSEILKNDATPSRSSRGEFLFDLVHTTFPDYLITPYDTAYYKSAVKNPCRVRLALESEWGSAKSPALNFHRVLEDAAKLAVVRADVKVMNFSIDTELDRDVVAAALGDLRRQAGDDAPWLWVAVPHRERQGNWTPTSGVIKT